MIHKTSNSCSSLQIKSQWKCWSETLLKLNRIALIVSTKVLFSCSWISNQFITINKNSLFRPKSIRHSQSHLKQLEKKWTLPKPFLIKNNPKNWKGYTAAFRLCTPEMIKSNRRPLILRKPQRILIISCKWLQTRHLSSNFFSGLTNQPFNGLKPKKGKMEVRGDPKN